MMFISVLQAGRVSGPNLHRVEERFGPMEHCVFQMNPLMSIISQLQEDHQKELQQLKRSKFSTLKGVKERKGVPPASSPTQVPSEAPLQITHMETHIKKLQSSLEKIQAELPKTIIDTIRSTMLDSQYPSHQQPISMSMTPQQRMNPSIYEQQGFHDNDNGNANNDDGPTRQCIYQDCTTMFSIRHPR